MTGYQTSSVCTTGATRHHVRPPRKHARLVLVLALALPGCNSAPAPAAPLASASDAPKLPSTSTSAAAPAATESAACPLTAAEISKAVGVSLAPAPGGDLEEVGYVRCAYGDLSQGVVVQLNLPPESSYNAVREAYLSVSKGFQERLGLGPGGFEQFNVETIGESAFVGLRWRGAPLIFSLVVRPPAQVAVRDAAAGVTSALLDVQ